PSPQCKFASAYSGVCDVQRAVASFLSRGTLSIEFVEASISASGHLRPDSAVGWGGSGQIGRRARWGYFSIIHPKFAAVPNSFAGASECLTRSASSRISVAGPAADGYMIAAIRAPVSSLCFARGNSTPNARAQSVASFSVAAQAIDGAATAN